MIDISPTLEFEKSDHAYPSVPPAKGVALLLLLQLSSKISNVHDDFFSYSSCPFLLFLEPLSLCNLGMRFF
jgi:hypothetical protein